MHIRELDEMNIRKQDRMILEEMMSRGILFKKLSENKIKISHGKKSYIIKNGRVRDSPNNPLVPRIVGMKDVTSRILRRRGFNAIENTVFNKTDVNRAWNWAQPILPVVLKPAGGNLGKDVYVNISDYDEFKKRFNQIGKKHNEILVEQFIEGQEYRFLCINNEIVAVNKRIRANVVGNGKNSILELVEIKNKRKEKSISHKKIKLNNKSQRVITKQGYTLNSIPSIGEIVFIRETSNIATGGDAIDVTDEIDSEVKEHIRKAVRSIKGLFIGGVDVLIKDDTPYIIEVNTLPGMLGHDYPWEGKPRGTMKKLVDEMFPDTIIK